MTPTIDLLLAHRSIRAFAPEPVPDEHLRRAVEAGQAASTSSAVQTYSVIRVTDEAVLGALVPLTGNQGKIAECGAFLVVCGDVRRHMVAARRQARGYQAGLESFLVSVIDSSLFAQNMCIALESMGYGICYIGGIRNDLPRLDALLRLPEGVFPLFGLCVGVPAEEPDPRPRLPPQAVYFQGAYPGDEELTALMDEYDGAYRDYLSRRGVPRPTGWTERMAHMNADPGRTDIGVYYRSKGADFSAGNGAKP